MTTKWTFVRQNCRKAIVQVSRQISVSKSMVDLVVKKDVVQCFRRRRWTVAKLQLAFRRNDPRSLSGSPRLGEIKIRKRDTFRKIFFRIVRVSARKQNRLPRNPVRSPSDRHFLSSLRAINGVRFHAWRRQNARPRILNARTYRFANESLAAGCSPICAVSIVHPPCPPFLAIVSISIRTVSSDVI